MQKFFLSILFFSFCFVSFILYKLNEDKYIPKVIHYIWLGGKKPPKNVESVIKSWKKNAPNYYIKRWDESNLDVNKNEFVKKAYSAKKWAFVSDYFRYEILYYHGGLYLDVDHFLNKNPDIILNRKKLVVNVFEINSSLSMSFIAAPKNQIIFKKMMENYNKNTDLNVIGPIRWTKEIKKHYNDIKFHGKHQTIQGLEIYPANILMFDFGGGENIAMHVYDSSWLAHKVVDYYKYFKDLFLKENAKFADGLTLLPYGLPKSKNFGTVYYDIDTKKKYTVQIKNNCEKIVEYVN